MALKVGDAAPNFKLTCATGELQGEFELSAQRGKNVVLAFYPLDFTPVCQSELGSFQADLEKFTNANTEVLGICTDSVFAHIAFQKHLGGLKFPLATDRWPYAEVGTAYGVSLPPSTPFRSSTTGQSSLWIRTARSHGQRFTSCENNRTMARSWPS